MKRYNIQFDEQEEIDFKDIQADQGFDKILLERKSILARQKAMRKLVATILLFITPIVFTLGYMNRQVIVSLFNTLEPKKKEVSSTSNLEPLLSKRRTENKEEVRDETIFQPKEINIVPALILDELEVEPKEDLIVAARPGIGYDSLKKYFDNAIVFTENEIGTDSVREATVTFWINKKGRPEGIRITERLDEVLKSKVMKSVKSMPSWSPSTINGEAYRSMVGLKIVFKIENKNSE